MSHTPTPTQTTMSDLKKGDLLYNRDFNCFGNFSHRIDGGIMVTDTPPRKKISLPTHEWSEGDCTKATKEQVTEYIRGLGWVYYTNSYVYEKEGNQFEVAEFDTGEYRVSGNLDPKDFITAPAQLAEAIQVATLLNAVKD